MVKLPAFSLIELIVAMALLGVITVAIVITWIGGIQRFTTISQGQTDSTAFLETYTRMNNYVRIATEFPANYTAPNSTTYTAGATTLIMKVTSLSSAYTSDCPYNDYVVYTLDQTNLHEIVFADSHSKRPSTDQILMNNVSSLALTQTKNGSEHRSVDAVVKSTEASTQRTAIVTHEQVMVARND